MPRNSDRRLSRLIVAARAAIAWERLWPAFAPMVGVVVVFVASAWMGLWLGLPAVVRMLGLGVFAVLFVASGWRLLRLTLPGDTDAMRRLERDARLDHRPLATYADALAPTGDGFAERVWRVHRQRAEARLSALRLPVPDASLVTGDPFAVRSVVGILLFVGLLVGAGALAERLITPFDFSEPAEASVGPQFRLDAWVTPPAYTGRSPLFLSAATRVETGDGIRVPAGSILTVRSQGVASVDLGVLDENGAAQVAMTPLSSDGEQTVVASEGTVTIDRTMTVDVREDGETIESFRFGADPDRAPTARFTQTPQSANQDTFELRYELGDDYAIASAEAVARPVEAPAGRRPLLDDPTFPLTLPGGAGARGEGRTVQDLTAHPYAGREMEITLSATDGLGQTGSSRPETFRLPSRAFTNKVAKALIEQRARLAMDADAQIGVIDAIDLVMLDAGAIGTAGAFLAVDAAYHQLVAATTDDELREVLSVLWEVALVLEDDGLSDAERALKAAQEELRQALEDGASPEEIARLTRELREAMQDYMRALARQDDNAPKDGQPDPNAKEVTQQDIDAMLKRIEELAREGREEEAEALLSEMQQMMENLQMAQRGQGQGQQQGQQGGQNQEGQTLEELGRMIQEQQKLMDDTYGMNPGEQRGRGQRGRQGQDGQGGQGGRQGQDGQQRQPFGGQGQGQGQFGQQFGQGEFGQPGPDGPMGQYGQRRGPPGRPGSPQGGPGDPDAGGEGGPGTPGSPGEQERADALRGLADRQGDLKGQLGELMRRLEEQGFDPGDRMGDAERSMGDAGSALGDNRAGEAVTDQADALQALREGAQSMAQQLAEAQQQGDGNDSGDAGESMQGPGRDPLGRTRREGTYADTSRVGVPDEIESQRARRILQELRRRLGDMLLPRIERDYLERLIP